MKLTAISNLLLAQMTTALWWTLPMVAILLVLGYVSRRSQRREAGQPYHSPRALFRELCRAHGLNSASRRLLRRLAAQRKLRQPAELFLLPDSFEPTGLSPALQARQAELAFLQTKLFESAEPERVTVRKRGEIVQIALEASRN